MLGIAVSVIVLLLAGLLASERYRWLSPAWHRERRGSGRYRRPGFVTISPASSFMNQATDQGQATSTECKPDGRRWAEPAGPELRLPPSSYTAPGFSTVGLDGRTHPPIPGSRGQPASSAASETDAD